jgi:tetratricopeptide (TPR) repeat protein
MEVDPNNALAASYLVQTWLAKHDFDKAAVQLERVMSLDPSGDLGKKSCRQYADACLEEGTTALKTPDYDKAISYFNRASKYAPDNARIFDRRAFAWLRKEDFPKAIEDYTTLLGIEKNDVNYIHRGLAYQGNNDLVNALADFTEAANLNPRNAAAFANRGGAYMRRYGLTPDKGDLTNAKADLSTAVEICRKNPNSPDYHIDIEDALWLRALCYMLAEEYELAASDFDELIHLNPEMGRRLHARLDELAANFADAGNFSKAAEWETKAVEGAPDDKTKADYRSRLTKYQTGKP